MLTGIDVHCYIIEIQLCHSIIDAFQVCVVSVCAFSDVEIGN